MEGALFLIDVIKILPEDINCFIQAPSLDGKEILNMMVESEFLYFKVIKLNLLNKDSFIKILSNHSITQDFHHIEIRLSSNNKKLFEGWDGIEFGHFSKDIEIPNWFEEKYLNEEMYYVSEEW